MDEEAWLITKVISPLTKVAGQRAGWQVQDSNLGSFRDGFAVADFTRQEQPTCIYNGSVGWDFGLSCRGSLGFMARSMDKRSQVSLRHHSAWVGCIARGARS